MQSQSETCENLYGGRERSSHRDPERAARLHQFSGRVQQLAVGERNRRKRRAMRCDFFQTREPHQRGDRKKIVRTAEKVLLCRRCRRAGRFASGVRLRPCPRHRPHVLLRRLGGALRRVRRSDREDHRPRSFRRRHRAFLFPQSAGNFKSQAQRLLQYRENRQRLQARSRRAQTGIRRDVRTGAKRV